MCLASVVLPVLISAGVRYGKFFFFIYISKKTAQGHKKSTKKKKESLYGDKNRLYHPLFPCARGVTVSGICVTCFSCPAFPCTSVGG